VTAPHLVLVDRDGVLNRKAPEGEYILTPDELELLPDAAAAVRRLNECGIPVAVVTNQRAVALGRLTEHGLAAVHDELARLLAAAGAHVDALYYCPHDRDACDCRKPAPGMLTAALAEFDIAPRHAVMIGDADSDVEAGRRAGVDTVQVGVGEALSAATWAARDLREAVELLLGTR
jgi:D-glycero-D-manno-heptose 1,7-bisphosphate phosphatase